MISTILESASAASASITQKSAETSEQANQPEVSASKQEVQQGSAGAHSNAVIVSISGDYSVLEEPKPEQFSLVKLVSTEGAEDSIGPIQSVEASNRILDFQNKMMETHRERMEFLEQTEPVPARALEGDEAKETLRMLNAFRPGDVLMGVSESGRRSWEVDSLVYALYPDGTLTVNKAGVPTSQHEHDYMLNHHRNGYNDAKSSVVALEASLAALHQNGNEVVA